MTKHIHKKLKSMQHVIDIVKFKLAAEQKTVVSLKADVSDLQQANKELQSLHGVHNARESELRVRLRESEERRKVVEDRLLEALKAALTSTPRVEAIMPTVQMHHQAIPNK